MPCDYARYPDNWPVIREAILLRAGSKCEECGANDGAWGWRDPSPGGQFERAPGWLWPELESAWKDGERTCPDTGWRIIRIVLTIAHVHDEDPMNVDEDNLRALCQACHNRLDAPRRAERRRAKRACGDLFA